MQVIVPVEDSGQLKYCISKEKLIDFLQRCDPEVTIVLDISPYTKN